MWIRFLVKCLANKSFFPLSIRLNFCFFWLPLNYQMLSPTMWHFLSLSVSQVFAFIIPMTTKDFFHCENKNLHLKPWRWQKNETEISSLDSKNNKGLPFAHYFLPSRTKIYEQFWDLLRFRYDWICCEKGWLLCWKYKPIRFHTRKYCVMLFATLNSNRQIGFITTAVVFQSYLFACLRCMACMETVCVSFFFQNREYVERRMLRWAKNVFCDSR